MTRVQVYVYDLTKGMAAALSPMLLGHQIPGVWHTGVVVDGDEHFFGHGLHRARAGTTMFGTPHHVIDVGDTEVPPELREELLADLAPRFRPEDYSLLWHNCNHFSHEFCQLLTGEGLPDYILNQAQTLFNTPWGEQLMPMVMALEGFTGQATATGLASPEAAAFAPPGTAAVPSSTAARAAAPPAMPATAPAAASLPAAVSAQAASSEESPQQLDDSGTLSAPAAADGAVDDGEAAATQAGAAGDGSLQDGTSISSTADKAADKVVEGLAGVQLTADGRAAS